MSAVTRVTIEINDAGDVINTTPFQLLQWRHALKLEKLGMTMSGGRKVSTHLRKLLKQNRSYTIDEMIEWVSDSLDLVNDAMGALR